MSTELLESRTGLRRKRGFKPPLLARLRFPAATSGPSERRAAGLEDLGQLRFAQFSRRNGENHLDEFLLAERRLPAIHKQEYDCCVCADPLVTVDKRVILADVKKVRRSHGRNGGVQEFTAEGGLRRGYGRFEYSYIAKSRRSAVSFDLLLMHFQDFIQ